jgi:uncharacterized protein
VPGRDLARGGRPVQPAERADLRCGRGERLRLGGCQIGRGEARDGFTRGAGPAPPARGQAEGTAGDGPVRGGRGSTGERPKRGRGLGRIHGEESVEDLESPPGVRAFVEEHLEQGREPLDDPVPMSTGEVPGRRRPQRGTAAGESATQRRHRAGVSAPAQHLEGPSGHRFVRFSREIQHPRRRPRVLQAVEQVEGGQARGPWRRSERRHERRQDTPTEQRQLRHRQVSIPGPGAPEPRHQIVDAPGRRWYDRHQMGVSRLHCRPALAMVLALLARVALASHVTVPLTLPSGRVLQAEVMVSDEDRAMGLMFRPSLPADRGMIFVFEVPDFHGIWMKNCRFPIDIVWLDEDRHVVHVTENVPPCKAEPCPVYEPLRRASYVIELNAGVAERDGLRIGSTVSFELPR